MRPAGRTLPIPALPQSTPSVIRVTSLMILGVLFDDRLTFQPHITDTIKSCSQALFALRTLRHQGLSDESLSLTFSSKVLSKLTYGSPAWWGFISENTKAQLEAFIRKAIKFNYYPNTGPLFSQIVDKLENNLFVSITSNPTHCLHPLLPPLKVCKYDLRKRGHNYSLPKKDEQNFIVRTLYKLV